MLAKYLHLLEVEVAIKSQYLIVLQMGLFSQKVFKILVLQGWKYKVLSNIVKMFKKLSGFLNFQISL